MESDISQIKTIKFELEQRNSTTRMLNRNKTSIDFNKITNNNFKINERAMMLNWNKDKEVPYYGKRKLYLLAIGKISCLY